jgi:predicted TIM-barrel enzyme
LGFGHFNPWRRISQPFGRLSGVAEPLARVGFGAICRFPQVCAESGKFIADVDSVRVEIRCAVQQSQQ